MLAFLNISFFVHTIVYPTECGHVIRQWIRKSQPPVKLPKSTPTPKQLTLDEEKVCHKDNPCPCSMKFRHVEVYGVEVEYTDYRCMDTEKHYKGLQCV